MHIIFQKQQTHGKIIQNDPTTTMTWRDLSWSNLHLWASQCTLPWCACRAAPVTLLLRVVSQVGALVKMITPPCLRELTRSSPSHHRDVTRADPIRSLSQCTWPCCTCRAAPVTFCTSIALECSGISGVEENVFYVLKGYLFEWDVSRASPPLCLLS